MAGTTPVTAPTAATTTSELNTEIPMLQQHTLDQLRGLRLDGMIAALADPATQRALDGLTGIPVDIRPYYPAAGEILPK